MQYSFQVFASLHAGRYIFHFVQVFWMELVDSLKDEIIHIVDDFINVTKNIHFRIVVSGTKDSCGITVKLKLYKCRSCAKPVIISKVFIACSGDVLHFAAYLDGIVHLFNTQFDSGTDSDAPITE